MKKALCTIVLLLPIITGCGLLNIFKKPDPPLIPTDTKVYVDPRALEPCKPLVPLRPANAASEVEPFEILVNQKENSLIHKDCVSKQETSIIIIKKLSGMEK